MKTSTFTRLAAIALALGLTAGPASAAAIHGALFTSDTAGDVNVNIYDNKGDVYLNGGPTNDNCAAAGVDSGTYVYKVTNPNGDTLLSTDTIDHRQFTVTDGVITAVNDHPTVPGDCSSLRLQLAPFADTPNNGGEYKVWITRLSDYIANGETFKPGSTKTDNFKVRIVTEPEVGGITVYKFYDANGNGVWDSEEVPLFGWAMTVAGAGTQLTESPDGLTTFSNLSLAGNPYAVSEGSGGSRWVQSVSLINGAPSAGSPESPVSVTVVAGENTQVDFGNYCTCTIKSYTANFWIGSGGEAKLNDGATMMQPELTLLRNANLRNAAGGHFNQNLALAQTVNYAGLSAWLMGADSSTNEAYKLSAQLAVLKLNVEAGFNRGPYYFKGYGTITQIIADANAMLSVATCGTNCSTTTADPLGQDQHDLAALIEDINNGTTVIMPKPCAYKFTLPVN